MTMIATCERCLASLVPVARQAGGPELVCAGCAAAPLPAGPLSREDSRAALLADMAPKVTDQATASMAEAIADTFSEFGVTGITWADPE